MMQIHSLRGAVAALLAGASPARRPRRSRQLVFANVAEGTHAGAVTRTASAAFTTKFLLAKAGDSDGEVAVAGVADAPVGVVTDEADIGDPVAMKLLGAGEQTVIVVAAGAVATGAMLYTAANGQVQTEPGAAGTYYLVGRALTAASTAGDLVEAETTVPVRTLVIAKLNAAQVSTATATDLTTSEALANALKTAYNALQTDVAALGTALAAPAQVKVLTS